MIGRATRSRMADGRTLEMVSVRPLQPRSDNGTAGSDQHAERQDEQRPAPHHRVA